MSAKKEKINELLSYIKWNVSNELLIADVDRIFSILYRDYEAEDILFAWEKTAHKAPFVAHCTLQKYNLRGKINNIHVMEEMFVSMWSDISCFQDNKLSDYISLYTIYNINNDYCWNVLNEEPNKTKKCINALKNFELLGLKVSHILSMFINIYRHVDSETFIETIHESMYNLNGEEISDELTTFLCELFEDGAFRAAYLTSKSFNYQIERMQFLPNSKEIENSIYSSLHTCDELEAFRGILLYWDVLSIANNEEKVKYWYNSLLKIKNSNLLCEREGIRLIYMCKALYLSEGAFPDILRRYSIGIKKCIPISEEKRRSRIYTREYRKAIYSLLDRVEYEDCKTFIEATKDMNPDALLCSDNGRWPTFVQKNIGEYDANKMLTNLASASCSLETKVYIYMNTFLRGIVNFLDFLDAIYKEYGKQAVEEIRKYYIGGAVSFDPRRKIYYLRPNELIKKVGDKFFVHQESSIVLDKMQDELDGRWFKTKLWSYNPEKKIAKCALWGFGKERLEDIILLLKAFRKEGRINPELEERIRSTCIFLAGKDSTFVELCLLELKIMLDECQSDMAFESYVDLIKPINYYAFNPMFKARLSNQKTALMSDIKRRGTIFYLWERLGRQELETNRRFMIFCNSIFRHFFSISDFLDSFIKTNDEEEQLLKSIGKIVGTVGAYANDIEDDDMMLVYVAPAPFMRRKRVGRKETEEGETSKDMFVAKIPLMGESVTSLRKRMSISKDTPVSFEIVKRINYNTFEITNLILEDS